MCEAILTSFVGIFKVRSTLFTRPAEHCLHVFPNPSTLGSQVSAGFNHTACTIEADDEVTERLTQGA